MDIIEKLNARKSDLIVGKGATEEEIHQAEEMLGVKIAQDFKKCLISFGVFAFDGHEMTGITDNKRLSVVDVTKRQRVQNPEIPSDWYVIEEANMDGIVIWQNDRGTVFGTASGGPTMQIAGSLIDFFKI